MTFEIRVREQELGSFLKPEPDRGKFLGSFIKFRVRKFSPRRSTLVFPARAARGGGASSLEIGNLGVSLDMRGKKS